MTRNSEDSFPFNDRPRDTPQNQGTIQHVKEATMDHHTEELNCQDDERPKFKRIPELSVYTSEYDTMQDEFLTHCPEGLLLLSLEVDDVLKIEYLNQAAANMLDSSVSELQSRSIKRTESVLPEEIWTSSYTCILEKEQTEGLIQQRTRCAHYRMRRSQVPGRLLLYLQQLPPMPLYLEGLLSVEDQQWAILLQDACGISARLIRWDEKNDISTCIRQTLSSRDATFTGELDVWPLAFNRWRDRVDVKTLYRGHKQLVRENTTLDRGRELYYSCTILYVGRDGDDHHHLVISLDEVSVQDEHSSSLPMNERSNKKQLTSAWTDASEPAKEKRDQTLQNMRGIYNYCKGRMTGSLDMNVLSVFRTTCDQLEEDFANIHTDDEQEVSSQWKKKRSLSQYKMIDYMKKGSAYSVARARDHKGNNFVIKSIKKGEETAMCLSSMKEVEILRNLSHPNVLKLIEAIQTPSHYHLVTEFVQGVTLERYIKERKSAMRQNEVKCLFNQLAEGLAYCHKRGVSHRDVKPANVMVGNGGRVCLIDFGLSNYSSFCSTYCGTLLNNSPEMLNGQEYDGPSSDAWSAGVILFTLVIVNTDSSTTYIHQLTGKPPFSDVDVIMKGKVDLSEVVTMEAKDILSKLLSVDRRGRMTMIEYLKTAWSKTEGS
ncbi:sperm motility kinase 2B [Planoprotostelium fungivorum]|uniref:Sperm motility kinase 2B n=1 Tax=Planoprotostelium fungivorum TaxID=1890364 RepID=A0A2P6N489_9EUKA|nr:sperm motility kinase 2B [Planoprotostelium fungivorum]